MKKNKKFYLKTNIISFIIGGILVSGFGVYAAVTFPSNDVSYDNSSSGLSSTNVKGAIDELYTECTKVPTAGEQIIEDGGLEKDPYECRYFFTGANPNNYITFNGETAGWRIISVECDGKIKITRKNYARQMSWGSSRSQTNWGQTYSNVYMNEDYYNSLTDIAKNQITSGNYSVGAISGWTPTLADEIKQENATIWTGNVGLISVSEYIRLNSNVSLCGTMELLNSNMNSCRNTNWMYNDYGDFSWWSLNPKADSPTSDNYLYVFALSSNAGVNQSTMSPGYLLYPVVYLSSSVQITGGDGSQSNPYTIE